MSKWYDEEMRCYIFSYGFLWVGWILIMREPKPIPFYSDVKEITIEPDVNMEYLTFGFTQKGVFEKVKKKALRMAKKKE